jgi:hypothetical protein
MPSCQASSMRMELPSSLLLTSIAVFRGADPTRSCSRPCYCSTTLPWWTSQGRLRLHGPSSRPMCRVRSVPRTLSSSPSASSRPDEIVMIVMAGEDLCMYLKSLLSSRHYWSAYESCMYHLVQCMQARLMVFVHATCSHRSYAVTISIPFAK